MKSVSASTPQFTYSITPGSVPQSSTQSFTLAVTNSSSANVTVNPGNHIIVGNLSSLTSGNVTASQPASPWMMMQSGTTLRIWVTQQTTVQPGQSVIFSITGVQILANTGTASLTVMETLAGHSASAPDLDIAIVAAFSITASANPSTVGLGQWVTLQWTTVGAAYVTIQGSSQQYPAGTSSTKVLPAQNASQTIYTITAWTTGGGSSVEAPPVTVTLASPQVNSFNATPSQNIGIGDDVTLAWSTTYAYGVPTGVQVQPPPGSSPYLPSYGSLSVQPSNALPQNASQLSYVLTASGYGTPAISPPVTITFAPMVITCFRYQDFTKTSIVVDVSNAQTYQYSATATPVVLTAIGPGGPLTAELGGTGPEVQVLLANPSSVSPGGSVELQYLVANVTALTLNPGGQALTFDSSTGLGSVTVTPNQTTTYSLVATNGASTITSELEVVVTS